MTKQCSVCERVIHDGEEVIAVVRAEFHDIPSAKSYAITRPTECFDLRHGYCGFDKETSV